MLRVCPDGADPRFDQRRRDERLPEAAAVSSPTRWVLAQRNPAVMLDFEWRGQDSNRGHHDFQSWAGISLTTLKTLQFGGFSAVTITSVMLANCGRLLWIWALGCGSVPNQIAPSRTSRASNSDRPTCVSPAPMAFEVLLEVVARADDRAAQGEASEDGLEDRDPHVVPDGKADYDGAGRGPGRRGCAGGARAHDG